MHDYESTCDNNYTPHCVRAEIVEGGPPSTISGQKYQELLCYYAGCKRKPEGSPLVCIVEATIYTPYKFVVV